MNNDHDLDDGDYDYYDALDRFAEHLEFLERDNSDCVSVISEQEPEMYGEFIASIATNLSDFISEKELHTLNYQKKQVLKLGNNETKDRIRPKKNFRSGMVYGFTLPKKRAFMAKHSKYNKGEHGAIKYRKYFKRKHSHICRHEAREQLLQRRRRIEDEDRIEYYPKPTRRR